MALRSKNESLLSQVRRQKKIDAILAAKIRERKLRDQANAEESRSKADAEHQLAKEKGRLAEKKIVQAKARASKQNALKTLRVT